MTLKPHPLRIGLTGGIGCGKSTVSQMLAARGAIIIDADAIARSVTASNGLAMSAILQNFGNKFVDATGALNRELMRNHVFNHPEAKRTLETIIHPLVLQETQRFAREFANAGHHILVFDIPLLVEAGTRWLTQVDRILVIDCKPETQIQRVTARNSLEREVVEKIIATQATREQRLAAADWVIYNDEASLDHLRACVFALPLPTA